jgi:hypothetical protein
VRLNSYQNFTIINDNYILGTLYDELKTKSFIIDRNEKKLYISKELEPGTNTNKITGFFNNQIVYVLYPGEENIPTDLPENVKNHLNEENFVICLYELN